MKKMITAVGGSAADPPHKGHLAVLKALFCSELFDRVVWIISGDREDKNMNACRNDRIAMTELMIPREMRAANSPDLVVQYDDIYKSNTPTVHWLRDIMPRKYPDGEFIWFTGSDSVVPKVEHCGMCEIQAKWWEGKLLYEDYKFLIIERGAYPLADVWLPSNFIVLPGMVPEISSSEIRRLIREGESFEQQLPGEVADYIKRHNLYGYKEKA